MDAADENEAGVGRRRRIDRHFVAADLVLTDHAQSTATITSEAFTTA